MSVGTWGYGTGATTAGAHPFSLCIQGIDVIGSVPIESIAVSQSMSGNGTLIFTIVDPTSSLPLPEGWADVVFTEHGLSGGTGAFDDGAFDGGAFDAWSPGTGLPDDEVIFGGLVMGTELVQGPPGVRLVTVRCVDYGILLDRTPIMSDVVLGPGSPSMTEIIQSVSGSTPLGGLTALAHTDGGAIYDLSGVNVFMGYGAETVAARTTFRPAVEPYCDRVREWDWSGNIPRPASLWVTPLRQIASTPDGYTLDTAPLEIRQNPTTASHVAGENVRYASDHSQAESGVYVADSDTTYGGDNSDWATGTLNGYAPMPSSISRRMFVDTEPGVYGAQYLMVRGGQAIGEATVTSDKNFMVGTALTVYYPDVGLDDTFAIHAVTTRFLGGPDHLRRTEIQFGGELGTVARFNRTRFARAGVTT